MFGATKCRPSAGGGDLGKLKRKAALRLCRSGELSRASRILTSSGLAPANDDTIERLQSKHPCSYDEVEPDEAESDILAPSSPSDAIVLSNAVIVKVLRESPRGSAAGISGWRFEHLKSLLGGSTSNYLVDVISLVASGRLPEFATLVLSASCLIALLKSNGDVRPIAVGEAIRRCAAKAMSSAEGSVFHLLLSDPTWSINSVRN